MKVISGTYDKFVTKKLANKVIKRALSQKSKVINNPNKQLKCKNCGEGFVSKWYLLKHKCQVGDMELLMNDESEMEKSKKDLKCPKCIGIAFPSETALKHHKILHRGFKPYSCNVCNITFENEAKWLSHVQQSAKQSHCDECLQYFGCLIAKQRHVCLESSYLCGNCGVQFKKSLAFARHVERCKQKVDCHICGRKFIKRSAFRIHMKQMHDITVTSDDSVMSTPPSITKEAPNIFTTIDNFIKQGQEKQDTSIKIESETIHLNGPVSSLVMCSVIPTSNGKKLSRKSKNECEICHKVFRNLRAKVVHRRIHSSLPFPFPQNDLDSTSVFKSRCAACDKMTNFIINDKECKICQTLPCSCENLGPKFVCSECNLGYSKVPNEDLICKICREIFDDQMALDEHSKGHNNIANPMDKTEASEYPTRIFKCRKCGDNVNSLSAIKSHRKICMSKPKMPINRGGGQKICCLQCEKVIPNKLALDLHLKTCGNDDVEGEELLEENNELRRLKSTLNESALLNASGNGSIECSKCMKIFRTPKHLEMHDKLVHKDYQCKVCNLMFWKSDDLLTHFRVHSHMKQYRCDYCDSSFDSSMKLRFHRVSHFGSSRTGDVETGDSTVSFICDHCNKEFDTFRKFELHCKKLAVGPDGRIKILPKRSRKRNEIKKLRNEVLTGLHVNTCSNCGEIFDDERTLKEHVSICATDKSETVSSTTDQTDARSVSNRESGRETPVHEELDTPNCQISPSIFGDPPYDEEEVMNLSETYGEEEWTNSWNDDENDSTFNSTIDLIESAQRDEPITWDSNLVYLAVKAMDVVIRSRGIKRATTRVKKIIRDVFKLLVNYPVTIEAPHSCYICGKLFIHPQGITNHYYQKHGSRGILHSLSLVKTNKEFQGQVEKKPRKHQQRRSDKSMASDEGNVQVENNVSPKDEPVLLELRGNISKLLCHLVSDNDVLEELGWPKRLIDDVLIDVISRCENRPCLDARKSRLSRLRENITTLLSICVKEQAMVNFGWNSKPVDDVVKEMLAGGDISSA